MADCAQAHVNKHLETQMAWKCIFTVHAHFFKHATSRLVGNNMWPFLRMHSRKLAKITQKWLNCQNSRLMENIFADKSGCVQKW